MSAEMAQVVLAVITFIGAVVWLIALQFLVLTSRIGKAHAPGGVEPSEVPEALSDNWYFGSAEVEGEQTALMDKAVATLVKLSSQLGAFGPLKIVERTNNTIG